MGGGARRSKEESYFRVGKLGGGVEFTLSFLDAACVSWSLGCGLGKWGVRFCEVYVGGSSVMSVVHEEFCVFWNGVL